MQATPEASESGLVRVLIVDDEPDIARVLTKIIMRAGRYAVDVRHGRFDVARLFADAPPDVIFLDLVMPDLDGFEVIGAVRECAPDVPIVVISAHSSIENAVKAVRLGAFDFLPKPFDPETIELMLAKLVREFSLQEKRRRDAEDDPDLAAILGTSAPVQALREWILKVRSTNANVLIQGESGTGKELVARALHGRRGPFVALNMAAIPDDLAEAELFGHRQGAFTGAQHERNGLLAEADGGTLFLDEVNAMSPAIQAKLLRVIQDRRFRPVGSNREIPVSFRLISASNEDLEATIAKGQFRRDLYHRLRVLSTTVPPLRERVADLPTLADHFLHRYARAHGRPARRLAPAAAQALCRREWRGNIRELENLIEEAVILAPDDAIEVNLPGHQPDPVAARLPTPGDDGSMPSLAQVEHGYIATVLHSTKGNKAQAARILDIDYKTLLRKLAEQTG